MRSEFVVDTFTINDSSQFTVHVWGTYHCLERFVQNNLLYFLYFPYNNKHSIRNAIAEDIVSATSSFTIPYVHHEAHPNIRIVSVNGCKSCTALCLNAFHTWGKEAVVENSAAAMEIQKIMSMCLPNIFLNTRTVARHRKKVEKNIRNIA